jgi:hypothetical protein
VSFGPTCLLCGRPGPRAHTLAAASLIARREGWQRGCFVRDGKVVAERAWLCPLCARERQTDPASH